MAVSAPSWPRLAARLATAEVATLSGRWRTRGDGPVRTGSFAFRWPDDWAVTGEDGRPAEEHAVSWCLRSEFEPDGWCTAAGPVVPAVHDRRPAWQVELLPPPGERGLLTVVVDDATGLLLRKANAQHDVERELLDLVVDGPLDDALFAAQRAREAEHDRDRRRYDLALRRPVPTPRWHPWRRAFSDGPDVVVVDTDRGTGSVGRAPLGRPAPVADWLSDPHVHRLDARGWSWAVASETPMSVEEAQRVVAEVVEL